MNLHVLDSISLLHNNLCLAGIRVQSLKEGQITMDIDLRWGGDPSIVLAVEAALVASIPIQVGALNISPPFTVTIFMLQYCLLKWNICHYVSFCS